MRSLITLVVGLSLAVAGATVSAAGTSILFIGNSFTFGSGSAVRFYRNNTVTDLNNEGVGGVRHGAQLRASIYHAQEAAAILDLVDEFFHSEPVLAR